MLQYNNDPVFFLTKFKRVSMSGSKNPSDEVQGIPAGSAVSLELFSF